MNWLIKDGLAHDEEFEYRKKAIYYKPTTEKTKSIDFESDIMPKKLKETYSVFKEFNLLWLLL